MQNKQKVDKKKLILPLFLGAIMILSVIGFSLTYNADNSSSASPSYSDSYEYNGRTYSLTQSGWSTPLDSNYISFSYGPKELESLKLPSFSLTPKTYLAYDQKNIDSNMEFIIQRISSVLVYKQIRPVTSCIEDSPDCLNLPLVDCSKTDRTIIFIKQDKLEITQKDNCVYFKGNSEDLNKVSDKLLMTWLGFI